LNTAFEELKNPPFHLLKIPPLIRTLPGALKISPVRGERQWFYHWLESRSRASRRDEIGAITEAPETWPPLDWILMFEKALDCKGTRLRSFARFGLRSNIEHHI